MATKSEPDWSWQHTKRRLLPGNPLWEDGDYFCCLAAKQLPLDIEDEDLNTVGEFVCSIAGCGQVFESVLSYELHYNSTHRNVCTTCRRSFPTSYLLDIHISEHHDPIFDLLATQHNMYKCLVESCTEKFSQPRARKDHMITVHKYPSNYRFDRVQKKKPHSGTSETGNTHPMDIADNPKGNRRTAAPVVTMVTESDITGHGVLEEEEKKPQTTQRQFSYKVPVNVCFGHGASRGFQSRGGRNKSQSKGKKKHWHQQNSADMDTSVSLEQVNMGELASALESS